MGNVISSTRATSDSTGVVASLKCQCVRADCIHGSPDYRVTVEAIQAYHRQLASARRVRIDTEERALEARMQVASIMRDLATSERELEAITVAYYGQREAARVATGDEELLTVATEYGLTITEIVGRSRCKHVSEARQEVMYRLREIHGWGLKEIGFLVQRDHSSVIHGVKVAMVRRGLSTTR